MNTPDLYKIISDLVGIKILGEDLKRRNQGYAHDPELAQTLDLINGMLRGPDALEESLQDHGLGHLNTDEVIEHIIHRVRHFRGLGA